MRVTRLACLAAVIALVAACGGSAPSSTPFIVTALTPAPSASLPASFDVPTSPLVTLAPGSLPPVTMAPATPLPTLPPTPKPTKKPTPKPTPKPTLTPADLELDFDEGSVPPTWYQGFQYTIKVFVSPLGQQDVPNARVKLTVRQEGADPFVLREDTGPLVVGDLTAPVEFDVTLGSTVATTITAVAILPNGFTDTNPANNKQTISFTVQPAP